MELTADDIKTIREMRRWIQTNGQAGTVRPPFTRKVPRMISVGSVSMKLIKAPSGGIPGRVGTLLGGVICDVWKEAATTQQIEDSGQDIKVMNWTTSAVCVNGDRFGIAAWINGGWYVIAEDCNDEGTTLESVVMTSEFSDAADAVELTNQQVSIVSTFPDASYTLGAVAIP